MQQQEMLNSWNELQSRVELIITFQVESKGQSDQARMKSLKNQMLRSPIADLVISSLTAIFMGGFISNHIQEFLATPITAIPAVVVFALGILFINLSIRQLILSSELDYSSPVIETQTRLAKLRKLRVQSTQWTFIGGFSIWFIFPILLGQMVISTKLLLAINPAWYVCNVIFGLAMIPVIDWVMKKSKYARSLQDSIAGKGIVEAEAFLEEIREFKAS